MVTITQLKEITADEEIVILYSGLNRWYTGRTMSKDDLKIAKQAFLESKIDYVYVILDLEAGNRLNDIFDRLEVVINEYEKNNKELK